MDDEGTTLMPVPNPSQPPAPTAPRPTAPTAAPTNRPSPSTGAPTLPTSGAKTAGGDGWGASVANATATGSLRREKNGGPAVHIVYVLGDDIGWNDLGWQSTDLGPDTIGYGGVTPNLDGLAKSGIILEHFHALPACTVSRAALLTGVHSVHSGLYPIGGITSDMPNALPLHFRLLPQYLKAYDNRTQAHGVGKWDLGHYNKAYLPTARGFDSWYGYYSSLIGYMSHVTQPCTNGIWCAADWNLNGEPMPEESGYYSTWLFAKRAEDVIHAHDPATPLFLYFTPTNCHGPIDVPVELLDEHKAMLSNVPNHPRRMYAGCMRSLDSAAGSIVDALQANDDMWNNTFFIFSSDNGAVPQPQQAGSNYPLRGMKFQVYEGGTRVPAFVHSPLLPARRAGTKFGALFHITDWTRTLVEGLLGASPLLALESELHADSYDQMAALLGDGDAPRDSMIYSIDSCVTGRPQGAVRQGDMKLHVLSSNTTWWEPMATNAFGGQTATFEYPAWTQDMVTPFHQLYNISADPYEQHDLTLFAPEVVARLNETFHRYATHLAAPLLCPSQEGTAADNFVRTWRTASNWTVGPWIADPLFQYACSKEYCPPSTPSAAPSVTPVPTINPAPTWSFAPSTAAPSATAAVGAAVVDDDAVDDDTTVRLAPNDDDRGRGKSHRDSSRDDDDDDDGSGKSHRGESHRDASRDDDGSGTSNKQQYDFDMANFLINGWNQQYW